MLPRLARDGRLPPTVPVRQRAQVVPVSESQLPERDPRHALVHDLLGVEHGRVARVDQRVEFDEVEAHHV